MLEKDFIQSVVEFGKKIDNVNDETTKALELKADKNDTYSKIEVETLISTNGSTINPTYATKDEIKEISSELNNIIANVEISIDNKSDKISTYTKSEVDDLIFELETQGSAELETFAKVNYVDEALSNKANIGAVYTKGEVDKLIFNVECGIDIPSENIATVDDINIINAYIKENNSLLNDKIINKADLDLVYTKTELDQTLADSNHHIKDELLTMESKINEKADTVSIYDKATIDNKLVNLGIAECVSYDGTISGLPNTNVQEALDEVINQIKNMVYYNKSTTNNTYEIITIPEDKWVFNIRTGMFEIIINHSLNTKLFLPDAVDSNNRSLELSYFIIDEKNIKIRSITKQTSKILLLSLSELLTEGAGNIENVGKAEWEYNKETEEFEYLLEHSLDSQNIMINLLELISKNSMDVGYSIIDNHSILFKTFIPYDAQILMLDLDELSVDETLLINPQDWIELDSGFEITLNHSLDSEHLIVSFIDGNTNSNMYIDYTILDKSSIKVNTVEQRYLKVMILDITEFISEHTNVNSLINDMISDLGHTWSSFKIQNELANKIESGLVYDKDEVDSILKTLQSTLNSNMVNLEYNSNEKIDELQKTKMAKEHAYTKTQINVLLENIPTVESIESLATKTDVSLLRTKINNEVLRLEDNKINRNEVEMLFTNINNDISYISEDILSKASSSDLDRAFLKIKNNTKLISNKANISAVYNKEEIDELLKQNGVDVSSFVKKIDFESAKSKINKSINNVKNSKADIDSVYSREEIDEKFNCFEVDYDLEDFDFVTKEELTDIDTKLTSRLNRINNSKVDSGMVYNKEEVDSIISEIKQSAFDIFANMEKTYAKTIGTLESRIKILEDKNNANSCCCSSRPTTNDEYVLDSIF